MPSNESQPPKFAQIYFYDSNIDNQIRRRNEIMEDTLDEGILKELSEELLAINPFINIFQTAGEKNRTEGEKEVLGIFIHNTHGKDMRQYNAPTAGEVAAICFNDTPRYERDILIRKKDNRLLHISELHGAYDPLQYPLLFPNGEYGWHDGIFKLNI